MTSDPRKNIAEPRLLRTQADLAQQTQRINALVSRAARPPILSARYLIEPDGAGNANIVAGREWLLSTVGGRPLDELAQRGIDGRFVIIVPGYYEMHGMLIGEGTAAAMSMQVRIRKSGVTGRVGGVTANTRVAGIKVAGYYNFSEVFAEGDTVSIMSERIDGAGTWTPWVEAGRPGSWMELIYRAAV